MKRAEGTFKAHEGLSLFYQKWECDNPKGNLIITHGQAEHSDCYHRLAESIEDLGWNIYAWDLRGHGRSDGKRGYAESFNHYCNDYIQFLAQLKETEELGDRPKVILGHSMGGLIQLKALINSPEVQADGQVLSSPLLGLVTQATKFKENFGAFVSRVLPEFTMWNQVRYSQLTRDNGIIEEYDKDPLRHDRISIQVYLGMLSSMEYVQKNASKIHLPTLIQVSGDDKIVSTEAALEFYEHLGAEQKDRIIYEDSRHEVYNDLDREQAFGDLKDFLKGFES